MQAAHRVVVPVVGQEEAQAVPVVAAQAVHREEAQAVQVESVQVVHPAVVLGALLVELW